MEFLWIALTVGWLLLMTWLSHQSGPETARESEALARELRPLLPGRDLETANYLLRKAAHVVVFAVLAVLVLAGCGDFSLTLAGDGAGRTVTASGGVVLPAGTDRESWRTLTLKLDGRNASLALDGAPARRLPSRPAAGETIFVNVGRNPVFDVLISETPGVL